MRRKTLFVGMCVFVALAALAWGQGTTSRLTGVVTDSSGAVVPGATVILTNEGTGVSFQTTSSASGTYTFDSVQVGMYTVTVELTGFKKFVAAGNRVTIGVPTTVNVTLQVGGTAETVTVTGAAELVQTSTSGNIGAIVEQQVLQDLPIVGTRGRNPLDLVLTQPGVVSGANTGGGVHVHGTRDRAWNFTLDGIDTNETSAGGSDFSPLRTNPDSLVEFRVLTANPTAEFGRSSGAQVSMVTRSGTNEFHGSAFWFYRTPSFNANEWQNNLNGTGKRQFVQQIPGFSVGGPIIRNRTFFFTNWQWLRARTSNLFTQTVYTADARKGNWRYVIGGRNLPAGVSGASVDNSGNVLPGVNVGTYNVAGNDPQTIGLSSITQTTIGKTPLPNNFTVGDGLNLAGFTFTPIENEKQYDGTIKIDHAIDAHNTAFFRIAFGQQNTLCDTVNGGNPRFPGLPCPVNTYRKPLNWAANWRWSPTPLITNELVVGQNHFFFDFQIPTADASLPTFTGTDITQPDEYEYGNKRTLNTIQIVDNFSILHGAHAFKMGANIRLQSHTDTRGSVAGQNVSPLVNFSTSINTVDPVAFNLPSNINQTYDRPALERGVNFLLGRVGQISQGFVAVGNEYAPGGTLYDYVADFPEIDLYWQDSWKLRRNLTLDLGLRLEMKLSPSNPDNQMYAPDVPVKIGEGPSNAVRWQQGKLYKNDINNWGPSIGFAWDPFSKGKSSIRGNYRLAYDRISTFGLSSAIFQNFPGRTLGVVNTDFGQAGGRLSSLPVLGPPAGATPNQGLQPPALSNNVITTMDPDFRMPKTNMWSVSIQHEVWNRTVAQVSYIGNHGVGLSGGYRMNQVEIRTNGFIDAFNIVKAGGQSDLMNQLLLPDSRRRTTETGSDMVRRLYSSDLNLNSVSAVASSINSRIQGGRSIPDLAGLGPYFFIPFPQFTGAWSVVDSNDYSKYNALEASLERQFQQGFAFLVGYTFSKSLDTRSFDPVFTIVSTGAAQSSSGTPYDINDRRLNYAQSDFDRTHVFQARWSYELPFGPGRHWMQSGVMAKIVGGWDLSGFMTIQGGRPFTVYGGSYTMTNLVQTPANCDGCNRATGTVFDDAATGYKWYFNSSDRATFSTPVAGALGSTGRNFFRGPGSFRTDLGVLKRTNITESKYIEYRAEFLNLTNTPTFGFPTTTVTSSTFGRIRDSVISGSRKIQMALKFYF